MNTENTDAQETAGEGHNKPPTLFEESQADFAALLIEANNFADGEPVSTEGQALAVETLIASLKDATKKANERREEVNKPFNEGKTANQEQFNTLIGDNKSGRGVGVLALDACKKALLPWKQKLADELAAELKRKKEFAEAAAAELVKASENRVAGDLESETQFENAIQETKQSAIDVQRASKATNKGTTTDWVPTLVDGPAAANHYWQTNREEIVTLLMSLAAKDIRTGKREIPGFVIKEELKVR